MHSHCNIQLRQTFYRILHLGVQQSIFDLHGNQTIHILNKSVIKSIFIRSIPGIFQHKSRNFHQHKVKFIESVLERRPTLA